jgi:tRNA(Ile)-lysidine synthase TilS/MesJ
MYCRAKFLFFLPFGFFLIFIIKSFAFSLIVMEKCDKCFKKEKVFLPYGPHRFCQEHFLDFFENRIRKITRKEKMVLPKQKIAVALSGGKDSATALYFLQKIFSNTNKIEAIIVDEGIKGYRDKAIVSAVKLCKSLKIPFVIKKFSEEFGLSTDKIIEKLKEKNSNESPCSYCATLRNNLLNKTALEINADKIATGHNLDDEAQSIAMNFFEGKTEKICLMNSVSDDKNNFLCQE